MPKIRPMSARMWPGRPYPLGATYDGKGVNFAIFSEAGTRVELCVFESVDAQKESERIVLPEPGIRRGRGGLDSRRRVRRLLRRQRRNQQRMVEPHRLPLFENPLRAAKEGHVHGPSLYAKRVNRR